MLNTIAPNLVDRLSRLLNDPKVVASYLGTDESAIARSGSTVHKASGARKTKKTTSTTARRRSRVATGRTT